MNALSFSFTCLSCHDLDKNYIWAVFNVNVDSLNSFFIYGSRLAVYENNEDDSKISNIVYTWRISVDMWKKIFIKAKPAL